MPRGGIPKPLELKKIQSGVKLPYWLMEWLREQEKSHAVLIEEALCKVHNLKPPVPKKRK